MDAEEPGPVGQPGIIEPGILEVVIPVHNEASTLARNVTTLRAYLEASVPYPWRITVADNASTDGTLAVAERLAADPRIRVRRLEQKGRGRALKDAWLASGAAGAAYMDVGLSTNLDALLPLITPLYAGHADIGIGSGPMCRAG